MNHLNSLSFVGFIAALFSCPLAFGDGKVMPPKDYKGSLEEKAQEAIILFQQGTPTKSAVQDLILKIRVEGDAQNFAWIIPFPREPKITKEDEKLFKEVFDYVQARRQRRSQGNFEGAKNGAVDSSLASDVEVLSRKVVGDFDTAVVKENKQGALNQWLSQEGFQTLDDAEDVLSFYRDKQYVYACIKVSSEALESEKEIDSSPLRFRFETGGRDGIYFPMKLTGLQSEPFDVNLYVFYRAWLNDKLNKFGYKHRGFSLVFRDYDSPKCEPNAGKSYSLPADDVYLKSYTKKIPTLTKLLQKLHPGQKYYLTNLQARQLEPEDVREWSDDLWLFPFYTDRAMVPYDVRDKGPASAAFPNESAGSKPKAISGNIERNWILAITLLSILAITVRLYIRVRSIKQLASSD